MEDRLCEYCSYWHASLDDPTEFGQCRRYAPKPFVCSVDGDANEWEAHRYVKWPDCHSDNWCGEFKHSREETT